jgi:hypothetical protein
VLYHGFEILRVKMVLIHKGKKVTFPAADMETMKVILRILRILRVEPKRLKNS